MILIFPENIIYHKTSIDKALDIQQDDLETVLFL